MDEDSANVSLYDYQNSLSENLNMSVVIYTDSENVNINDILGIQTSGEDDDLSPYKVINASTKNDIKNSAFKVYEDGSLYATKGKFGCLEISEAEWSNSKVSILKGTIYENGADYLSPDEIKGLGNDEYTTHNIEIFPEKFEINAYGNTKKYETVKIIPLPNIDAFDRNGLVEISTKSNKDNAIYANGIIESNHFRSYKSIKISESNSYNNTYIESVMSNLSGLNIAFIVSDKNQFEFNFTENSGIYEVEIYLNGMEILTGSLENLTESQKNSISVEKNISEYNGIWRYRCITTYKYVYLVGCYTTSFNKALQPSTLFIQLGTNGNNGSIYLGNIKIVG